MANRNLSIRLAGNTADLEAVQRLRWQVFFAEMGASTVTGAASFLDSDPYDPLCDHLLVSAIADDGEPQVVGTYRLLRQSVARNAGGFYSANEFDLAPLSCARGELLELGRSCVLPAYRTSATIALLWSGIAEYIQRHRIGLMFGCASFPGTDPMAHAASLSWLHHQHLAAAWQRPRVLDGKGARMDLLERGTYDERRAMFALPPLIKGYLRTGATFGEGAYIDHTFNTVDVCVVMPVDAISDRYAARFSLMA